MGITGSLTYSFKVKTSLDKDSDTDKPIFVQLIGRSID
jgi:hypothetical protein